MLSVTLWEHEIIFRETVTLRLNYIDQTHVRVCFALVGVHIGVYQVVLVSDSWRNIKHNWSMCFKTIMIVNDISLWSTIQPCTTSITLVSMLKCLNNDVLPCFCDQSYTPFSSHGSLFMFYYSLTIQMFSRRFPPSK